MIYHVSVFTFSRIPRPNWKLNSHSSLVFYFYAQTWVPTLVFISLGLIFNFLFVAPHFMVCAYYKSLQIFCEMEQGMKKLNKMIPFLYCINDLVRWEAGSALVFSQIVQWKRYEHQKGHNNISGFFFFLAF